MFYTEVSAPSSTVHLPQQKPIEISVAINNALPYTANIIAPISRPTTVTHDTDEDEGLKHFEQVSFYKFCWKLSSNTVLNNVTLQMCIFLGELK